MRMPWSSRESGDLQPKNSNKSEFEFLGEQIERLQHSLGVESKKYYKMEKDLYKTIGQPDLDAQQAKIEEVWHQLTDIYLKKILVLRKYRLEILNAKKDTKSLDEEERVITKFLTTRQTELEKRMGGQGGGLLTLERQSPIEPVPDDRVRERGLQSQMNPLHAEWRMIGEALGSAEKSRAAGVDGDV